MKIESNPFSKVLIILCHPTNEVTARKQLNNHKRRWLKPPTMYSGRHNCPFTCHEQRCCHKAAKETTTVK